MSAVARCVFTPRAEADLDDIWYEIARDNIDAADRMIDRIGDGISVVRVLHGRRDIDRLFE